MKLSKEYLKENADHIGSRVYLEIKNNNLTNKYIAQKLGYSIDAISRKNRNTNRMYYTSDDLHNLAKIFNCRVEYLARIDDFRTNNDITESNKESFKKDYLFIVKYLNSIGINIQPGIFWRGTAQQFNNAYKELSQYLTFNSLDFYHKNKKRIDNNNYEDDLILSLKDNPIKEMDNVEDLKVKNNHNKCFYMAFYNKDNKDKFNRFDKGVIELRFFISFPGEEESLTTINITEMNNLFAFIDANTINTIKTLIKTDFINNMYH